MGRDPGRPVRDERRIVSCEIIASDHIGLAGLGCWQKDIAADPFLVLS